MSYKNAKTVLFASLIAAMVLSLSMIDFALAEKDNQSKTDLELLTEANYIRLMEEASTIGQYVSSSVAEDDDSENRYAELLAELNSRGMYDKFSQPLDDSMDGYEVANTQSIGDSANSISVTSFSPIQADNRVCTSCGETHNKKLSVRSGMEWNNSYFSWVVHREVGPWSAYVNTNGVGTSTAQIFGNESDVRMYVQTKSNHPVTYAALNINSEIFIKDQRGAWISLETPTNTAYPNLYYPYVSKVIGDIMYTEPTLPGPSKHTVTMDIYAIS